MQALPADGATAPRACCFSPGLSATGRLAERWGVMPDRLTLLLLPTLRGERVILRQRRETDGRCRPPRPRPPPQKGGSGCRGRAGGGGRPPHTSPRVRARADAAPPP